MPEHDRLRRELENVERLLERSGGAVSRDEVASVARLLRHAIEYFEAERGRNSGRYNELENRLLAIENSRFLRFCGCRAGCCWTGRAASANGCSIRACTPFT